MNSKNITLLFHEYSNAYISEGIDLKDKEKRLKIAVLAWNFCYWDIKARTKYFEQFREMMQSRKEPEENITKDETEIRKLMELKDKMFPNVKNQILDSYLKIRGKKQYLTLSISKHEGN